VYTQCPDCATVFRVTAEALRIAQGDVRCGVCSTTFNALENLSEQAFNPAADPEPPSPDDSMTVEELPGGENIELSAPVELAAVPDLPEDTQDESSLRADADTGAETEAESEAEAEAEAEAEDEERAMEFHGDAADLDRLFVVENAKVESLNPPTVGPAPSQAEPVIDLDCTDEHPILVLEERDDIPDEPVIESIVLETLEPMATPSPRPLPAPAARVVPPPRPPPPAPVPPPAPPRAVTGVHTAPRILIPDEMRKRLAEEASARAATADAAVFEPDDSPGILSQRWPWVAGVAALAFLLLLQVIHRQRDALVQSPVVGPAVAGVYGFLGLAVLAPTDLSAYELRQWGAASDPNEANRLMLRASIVNRAAYAQPFPLLRLTLQDRFGGTLEQGDIGPADYLPGAGGDGLLGPGERADALIRIVDPGSEAVGFELDVCLAVKGGVRCASQIKTAGP
jgi:predicted Zn finger-like uncharacterized protein